MTSLLDLMEAANFNCERIAELLIEEEANNNQHHQLGMTPVLEAAMFGLLSAVKAPLAAGVDANIRHGADELTLLDVAAVMGHVEVVRTLLEEHGVDGNDVSPAVGLTTLHRCVLYSPAHNTFLEVLDLLVAAGADLDARTVYGDTPLHLASQWQPSGFIATALLQRGATRDAASNIGTGRSPLDVAAQYGNMGTLRVLLAAGADATVRVDGVDYLFNDFNNISTLDVAAGYGQVDVIRELVRHGVDVNAACGDTGCTALHHAARTRRVGAVSALLDAGASITAQTIQGGNTPLHFAASSLALEAMLVLLRRGAPVRALKDDGVNRKCGPPLHLAAENGGSRGATEAVELLLKWGADVFEVDMEGKTVAEVVGDATIIPNPVEIAMAKVTRDLLAAESSRRRRRVLLLCLARTRTVRKRRGENWGKGKRKAGEEGGEEEKGRGGEGGGGGGSGGAVSSRADVGVSVEGGGRGKHQRTPSKSDGRRVRPGAGGGGSSVDGDGDRGGDGGGSGNGGDLDGVGAMLLELEKEDFFRALVMYL